VVVPVGHNDGLSKRHDGNALRIVEACGRANNVIRKVAVATSCKCLDVAKGHNKLNAVVACISYNYCTARRNQGDPKRASEYCSIATSR
jgi:hypothetical protein